MKESYSLTWLKLKNSKERSRRIVDQYRLLIKLFLGVPAKRSVGSPAKLSIVQSISRTT